MSILVSQIVLLFKIVLTSDRLVGEHCCLQSHLLSRYAIPQAVSKAKPIWSFLVTYCLPLDLKYSSRLPFPMNSVTRKILLFSVPPFPSSITRPSSRTRFSCCKDLGEFQITTNIPWNYSRHDFRLAKKVLSSNRWVFDQLFHSHLLTPSIWQHITMSTSIK